MPGHDDKVMRSWELGYIESYGSTTFSTAVLYGRL